MILQIYLIVLFVMLSAAAEVSSNVPNKCPQPSASKKDPPAFHYGHPDDCAYFFTCAHGQPILMSCPPGTVWNEELQTCVGYKSHYDNCTYKRESPAQPSCSGGALRVPHPTACQRYYNCSNPGPGLSRNQRQFETDCPYPQLFDSRDLVCKPFRDTYCGQSRVEAKDPCDYFENMCGTAHCEPCPSRLPSCVGRPDGVYEHPSKPGSPFYITCLSERLINLQSCSRQAPSPTDNLSSTRQPCVTVWEI